MVDGPGTCRPARVEEELNSLEAIVEHYIRTFRGRARRELEVYARQPTTRVAVERATDCVRSDGKRHSHQRRIPWHVLAGAKTELVEVDFARCRSFDEVHAEVVRRTRSIRGIGELTRYDIAHRIGAHLGLEPERVYLHSGTRVGARALGFSGGRKTLEMAELPGAFRRLTPAEVEDCLCIYKAWLQRLLSGEPETNAPPVSSRTDGC